MVCVLWGHAAVRCSLCRIGIICRLSQVLCNVTLCGNGEIEYCMRSNFLFRVEKGIRIGLSYQLHCFIYIIIILFVFQTYHVSMLLMTSRVSKI